MSCTISSAVRQDASQTPNLMALLVPSPRILSGRILSMALWRSPRYKFRVPQDHDQGILKEIAFDVTTSAPTFTEPSAGICHALDVALAKSPKRTRILDVGAG